MHEEAVSFCEMVRSKHPELFIKAKVLDVGSCDVNGNNRYLFTDCQYTGLDVSAGPNVDVVCRMHESDLSSDQFDVVICTEMLEHDPNWGESLQHMYRVLKQNGLMLITCATTGRPEHGTARSGTEHDNPGLVTLGEHYRNLTVDDLRAAFGGALDEFFFGSVVLINPATCDLYFYGRKR